MIMETGAILNSTCKDCDPVRMFHKYMILFIFSKVYIYIMSLCGPKHEDAELQVLDILCSFLSLLMGIGSMRILLIVQVEHTQKN
uniref:Vomeronasal type-2 receptor 26 n=1 Tax=Heterorhabditis bacteriophora TaxID=37862 RepID=A0A1I7W776_HETBA